MADIPDELANAANQSADGIDRLAATMRECGVAAVELVQDPPRAGADVLVQGMDEIMPPQRIWRDIPPDGMIRQPMPFGALAVGRSVFSPAQKMPQIEPTLDEQIDRVTALINRSATRYFMINDGDDVTMIPIRRPE